MQQPGPGQNRRSAAHQAYNQRRWLEAISGLSDHLSRSPGDFESWVALGHAYLGAGRRAEAAQVGEQLLRQFPQAPEARAHRDAIVSAAAGPPTGGYGGITAPYNAGPIPAAESEERRRERTRIERRHYYALRVLIAASPLPILMLLSAVKDYDDGAAAQERAAALPPPDGAQFMERSRELFGSAGLHGAVGVALLVAMLFLWYYLVRGPEARFACPPDPAAPPDTRPIAS